MTYEYSMMTDDDFVKNANQVKDLVIHRLRCDGVITDDRTELDYIVIVAKKGLFGEAWDKFWKLTPKDRQYRVMRIYHDDAQEAKNPLKDT